MVVLKRFESSCYGGELLSRPCIWSDNADLFVTAMEETSTSHSDYVVIGYLFSAFIMSHLQILQRMDKKIVRDEPLRISF